MSDAEPIRIVGVVKDQVGAPRSDGSPGSGLYRVPLRLSRRPSALWAEVFIRTWDHPPSWTSMHRPGTLTVEGDCVVLNRTTLEEVERVHQATLRGVLDATSREVAEIEASQRAEKEREEGRQAEHRAHVDDIADRITFD